MSSSIDFDAIPYETKQHPNWILWKLKVKKNKEGKVDIDPKTGKPKKTKIPYQVNGKWAKSNDPTTWSTFETVKETFLKSNGKYSGIGYVFDGKYRIIGIDYDDVYNPETGEWIDNEALKDILYIASYAEFSQSKKGIHVLVKGELPEDPREAKKQGRRIKLDNGSGREMYRGPQYFTFTGWKIEEAPAEINENQEAINELFKKYYPEKEQESNKNSSDTKLSNVLRSPSLTDEEVLDKCRKDKRHSKFFKLYDLGEWKSFQEYNSQSEADLGLCVYLAFYTQDPEQINRIFCKGKLYRPDWDRDSKGLATIKTAIFGLTTVWNPKKYKTKKEKAAKPEKVNVPFDVVSDHILKNNYVFSMRDNKQIYLYQDGVYRSEGTEAIIDTEVRNVHNDYYREYWDSMNPDFPLGHIPKATTKYINEALAYIRAYSHRPRGDIDNEAGRYINLQNGLFDLEKWEKIDHTPEYLSICQTPVNYDPNAECPLIEKFLREVAKPDEIDFLYEWFGYCLTVDVKYQKALMVYGIPGTGKSVLLALLETFIGIENCSAESLQKIEEDKYRAANLYGKRVNVCSDIPSAKLHKTEVFKKLVSGLDSIDAENKYQQPFKFKNVSKLAFSANKLPEGPKDPAFYERFCLIEFSQKFRGTKQDDKQLKTKLTTEAELSGLLNKALDGLKRLYENDKFSYSKTFEETEKEYILNSNPVSVFMEERTVISDRDIDATVLYASYIEWSKIQNREFVSRIEFGRKLTGMGYTNYRTNVNKDGSKKATLWANIQLKQPEKNENHSEEKEGREAFGQDLGQDQINRSCPKISSQQTTEFNSKNAFGQDPFSYVSLREEKNFLSCENIETVEEEKNTKNENTANRVKTSCPSVCFFDSGEYGQDVLKDPVLILSEQAKITNLSKNEVENCLNIIQMRKDLATFKNTFLRNNGGIEGVEVFVGAFLKSMPGYLQLFPRHAIIFEAGKICKVA
jgi:P4 family phage/plasmid primase-like protien